MTLEPHYYIDAGIAYYFSLKGRRRILPSHRRLCYAIAITRPPPPVVLADTCTAVFNSKACLMSNQTSRSTALSHKPPSPYGRGSWISLSHSYWLNHSHFELSLPEIRPLFRSICLPVSTVCFELFISNRGLYNKMRGTIRISLQ